MGFKLTNCGGFKGFKGCRRSFFKTHTPPHPPLDCSRQNILKADGSSNNSSAFYNIIYDLETLLTFGRKGG
jgi:hypothetical protein